MNVTPPEELVNETDELRDAVREIVNSEVSMDKMLEVGADATGHDEQFWKMVTELGWLSIEIPEEYGGGGADFATLGVVVGELGRRPISSPFFATAVLGVGALLHSGSEDQRTRHLPAIAAGELIMTAAIEAAYDGADAPRLERSDDGRLTLRGTAKHVLDAHVAGLVAVAVADDEYPDDGVATVVLVDGDALAGRVTLDATMDATRRLCTIDLDGVTVDETDTLGRRGDARALLDHLTDRAAAAMAMDALGGAEEVVSFTVDYVSERHQFGRPVGSFQAVKHHCADMFIRQEVIRVAATQALAQIGSDDPDDLDWPSIASSVCGDAYLDLTSLATQSTGGMGYTWEYGLHFYLKRAAASQLLFGRPSWHRSRLAAGLVATHATTNENGEADVR